MLCWRDFARRHEPSALRRHGSVGVWLYVVKMVMQSKAPCPDFARRHVLTASFFVYALDCILMECEYLKIMKQWQKRDAYNTKRAC